MIIINGVEYSGRSVSITNGQVVIDGVIVTKVPDNVMSVEIKGTIDTLNCDRSVNVNGKIMGNVTANGSVNCDDVGGNVVANGSVNCDRVYGTVKSNID